MRQTQPPGKSILPNVRRSGLTKDETLCLWRAAIKDDADFIDAIIDKIYDEMTVFDCARAETVIELIVKRSSAAKCLFEDLLQDIQTASPNLPRPQGSKARARG